MTAGRPLKLSVVDQSPVPAGSTAGDALANTIDLARLADALGYERYWLAEHHATQAFAGSAPEVLIARVAAETRRIRVGSGGVMLPHYSPLKIAEVFRTLEALHPGRIDLGVGRAPGGTPLETLALRRERGRNPLPDDFPDQLVELLAFLGEGDFGPEHPFGRIRVSPETSGAPEVWLLGSSMWSASAAAQLGLPYAFAHFIDPRSTRAAVEHYRARFAPAGGLAAPRAVLATGAICADTDEEAKRLSQSLRLFRRLLMSGQPLGKILAPEEAVARLEALPGESASAYRLPRDEGEWPRVIVGATEQVHATIAAMAEALGVDEVMIVTVVHDHAARRRSYELLAEAFELSGSPAGAAHREA